LNTLATFANQVTTVAREVGVADRFISKVGGPELLFETVAEVLRLRGQTVGAK
jgi:hypothetical protein